MNWSWYQFAPFALGHCTGSCDRSFCNWPDVPDNQWTLDKRINITACHWPLARVSVLLALITTERILSNFVNSQWAEQTSWLPALLLWGFQKQMQLLYPKVAYVLAALLNNILLSLFCSSCFSSFSSHCQTDVPFFSFSLSLCLHKKPWEFN